MMRGAPVLGAAGFVARLVYFLVAPFVLLVLSRTFPVWGTIVNLVLILVAFFAAEPLRRRAQTSRLVSIIAGRQLELDAYYRARPPRPFLYYVLYPLMAPYWLFVREARREFLLFKGYTIVGFLIVAVLGVIDYTRNWAPEIPLGKFLAATVATMAFQLVLLFALLMPIATSIITYGLARQRKRLGVLAAVGALSMAFGVIALVAMPPTVNHVVRSRVHERTRVRPVESAAALERAVGAARAAILAGPKGRTLDDVAREALRPFYRADEVLAFQVARSRWGVVVYTRATRKRPPVWAAMRPDGQVVRDLAQLPAEMAALLAPP